MKLIDTSIADVKIIEPRVFGDPRGFFMETWSEQAFADLGLDLHFVQDNHSRSRQGILRGLHYQIQNPQGKLVRVTQGKVFDVAVDIRRNSPSFGQWVGMELSEDNPQMLWVPPGFAHGFYVMSASVDFLYKCTDVYAPEYERSLQWDDPTLAITWPLVDGDAPLLSTKDAQAASWQDAEMFE
jgi:dTDP-4-dehydrorhamnose 3,5-epimerase